MKKFSKSKSLIAFIMTIVFIFTNFSTAFAQVESKKNSINSSIVSENSQINIKEAISNTAQYMINQDKDLSYGKEWCIMSLSRAGIKLLDEYYENYYNSVVEEVNYEYGDFSKITDLERIILALNSIGKDPTSVGDYNLIDKLCNYENITKQGLNGPVFALLALDSKKYEEPKNAVNTRESLIKSILEFKTEDGGFSLFENSKNADVDMTAMTLQALSNYMDNEEVKEVVESSLKVLSENQLDNGGYKSEWSGENVQSSAQVIVALTALGKDILDSSNGFVKKDGNLLSYVMTYQNKNGGFEHPKGTINSMATEQAMYGLVSYDRFADGKNKLYDMSCEETSDINANVDLKIQYLYTSAFLKNKINKAKDYNKENYTEASFNLLESAISKGEETKDNIESKQENLSDEENKDLIETAEENIKDIDNAENNLEENKDELKKQWSQKLEDFKEIIKKAENYKEKDYTEDSFKALTEALTKGREIASKLENDKIENSSEEDLQSLINKSEKIIEDIESAINNLEKSKENNAEGNLEENKDDLKKKCLEKLAEFKEKITEAENCNEGDYTEDSFEALTEAITNSNEIIGDIKEEEIENLNDEDIQDLIKKLEVSILSIDNAMKSLSAKSEEAKITFSVEIRTLGKPDIIHPTEVNIKEEEPLSEVLERILNEKKIKYAKDITDTTGAFYLSSININKDNKFGDCNHGMSSGWTYSINGLKPNLNLTAGVVRPDVGMERCFLKNGDVVRICYTCRGYGQDIDCLYKREKLKEIIKKTEELSKEEYTERTFNILCKSIKCAETDMLSDKEITNMILSGVKDKLDSKIEEDKELTELEKKFDDYIEEIENAIKDLVKVNMTEYELKDQCIKYLQTLKDNIEKGKTYEEKDYTEDSFNLLKDAITNSKETISDTDEDKIKNLSKDELQNLLNTFENNLDNIDKAINNLKETNTELKTQCLKNSELLKQKIEEGKKCNKDNYTEDSFKALEDAISNSEKILGDLEEGKIENLNKEQLQSLIKTAEENIESIGNAISNLKETSIELKNQYLEKAKLLNEKIEEGKKQNKEDYTEDSFKALEDAITKGKETAGKIDEDKIKKLSKEELQSLIETAEKNMKDIANAISNLKENNDKLKNQCLEKVKSLKDKIEEGKKYTEETYTEDSFKALQDVIIKCEQTLSGTDKDKIQSSNKKALQSLLEKIQASIVLIDNSIKSLKIQTKDAKVTFSIERRVLGQPDIMPPTQVNIKSGELTSVVLDRILKDKNIKYKNTGEIEDSFYLASMTVDGKNLGEFDHGYLSGWMYSLNGSRPNVGMAGRTLKNGDVVRIYYTCKAFGQDIDCVDKIFNLRDKVKEAKGYNKKDYTNESFNVLSKAIKSAEVDIPSDEQIGKIMSTTLANSKFNFLAKGSIVNAIAKEGDSGTWIPELDEELAALSHKFEKHIVEIDNAIKALVLAEKPVIPSVNVDEAINGASKWILEDCPNPTYSNEWYILGLARGGYNVPSDYYKKYYESVKKEVKKQNGNFRKVTDLERIILAVTSIGKDPTNVGGYNLIDILFNYQNVNKQGLNGPVFALIALDTNEYSEPANAVNTRDSLIKEIMKYKTIDGGFSLFEKANNADVDMTAMTLQALSNYTHRSDVKNAVDSSLKILSKIQLDNGGYKSDWSGENVQSPAQVIVALTALGKDIMDPENEFVKENGNLLSAVMEYKNSNGAFEHPKNVPNGMATEQSLYTLVSYKRFCDGKQKLYDMSDVDSNSENKEDILNKLRELKDCLKEAKECKDVDYTEESHSKLKSIIEKIEKYIEINEKNIEKEKNKDELKKYFKTMEDYLNELDDAVKNLKKRPSENLEIKNNDNNIKVNFNKGILPENSILNVKNIIKDDESKYTSAKQILSKINSTSNLISLYDIKIEADGKVIEPKDYVSVSITLPEDYVIKDNKIIKVVKLLEDGSVKEFDCKLDGKNIIFKTKEFSLYSIIEVDKEDKPSTENKTDNNSTDDEGNGEVSDNENSNTEANVSYSRNDRGSSSSKSGLTSRNRGTSSSSGDEGDDGEEDEDEDSDEESSEDINYDKEMIDALKENNGDLREAIGEFKNLYSSNMNKAIGGLVGLTLISNIGIVLFMKKKK